jgi:hypothetical protein|tara:strand:+ start:81 stop:221 length:141 start_codon:yes stop_codon:yes gene_type:complete
MKVSEKLRDLLARMEESDRRIQELIEDHLTESRKLLSQTEEILRDN